VTILEDYFGPIVDYDGHGDYRSIDPEREGTVVAVPWVNFAHNRSEALEFARNMADYTLMMDADDTLEIPEGFTWPEDMTADSYSIDFHFAGMRYSRVAIFSNQLPWRFKGVLHEFPDCPEAKTQGHLPLIVHVGNDGARRRDPDKYRKDAQLLEQVLETETDPVLVSRYWFYLGQSWRDAGEPMKAILAYRMRLGFGGWEDETYIARLNIARCMETTSPGWAIEAYRDAHEHSRHRGEAIYKAAYLLRMAQRYQEAFEIARKGIGLPVPNGLFVEPWVHEYGILDEYAISAYWSGHYQESVIACDILLSEGKGPDRERYVTNANFARRKLLGG
jgi:tetratricopeptide (TPR) repeat protein